MSAAWRKASERIGVDVLLAIGLHHDLAAADRGEHVVEREPLLPRLAAERERDFAGRLQLVGGFEEVLPGIRLGRAELLEERLVVKEPVLAVHVDRHRVKLAVASGRIDQRLRQEVAPFAGRGDGFEIEQQALRDEVVELLAGIELHGGGRIAADDAVGAGRARVLADGDGGIDPLAALRFVHLGKDLDRRGFAAGSPPMQNFRFLRGRGARHQGHDGGRRHQMFQGMAHILLPCSCAALRTGRLFRYGALERPAGILVIDYRQCIVSGRPVQPPCCEA